MKLGQILVFGSLVAVLSACGGRTDSSGRGDGTGDGIEADDDFLDPLDDDDGLDDAADDDFVEPTGPGVPDPTGPAPAGGGGPVGMAPGGMVPLPGGMTPAGPGAGPVPGMQPLPADQPWPEDCEAGFYDSYEFGCQVQLDCSDSVGFVFCDGGAQEAQCFCEGPGGGTQVFVEGASPNEACSYAAQDCLTGQKPAPPAADEQCELTSQAFGGEFCDISRNCISDSRTSDDGVTVSVSRYDGVNCGQQGDGWYCNCYNTGVQFSFEGAGASSATCEQALDVCDEASLGTLGEPMCVEDSLYASRYDCSITDRCQRSGATASGVNVELYEYRSVNCYNGEIYGGDPGFIPPPGVPFPGTPIPVPPDMQQPSGDPNLWTCSCNGAFGQTGEQFELKGERSLDICEQASDVCQSR